MTEDGREFYVELSDGYEIKDCSEFVMEHVLPQLDLAKYGCTKAKAQADLARFVEDLHSNIQIASDAPQWDWEFFCELMYKDGHWPVSVLNRPLNLIDMYNELESVGIEVNIPELPHHALLDARILADLYRSMQHTI